MPKTLTERQCRRLPEGVHRAAPSLYLSVRGGSRLWVVRYCLAGKARSMSLGSMDNLPLEAAIAAAAAARADVRLRGVDVLAERRATRAEQQAALAQVRALEPAPVRKAGHTFGELLDVAVQAEARAKGWKHGAQACTQWLAPVKRYCAPLISKDVTQITEAALVEALAEPWVTSHLQATRALQRTITMMGHARRMGWIAENPLALKRLQERLPAMPKHKSRHHAALSLRAVPGFVATLVADGTPLADLLQFLILSGTRANEAASMRWSELDLADRVWSIPAERMKAKRAHRVPLTDTMLEMLKARQQARTGDSDLVFPGKGGKPFTNQQVLAHLIAMGHARGTVTVHGFRSCLRQFLAEHT
ncbi:integrase family protein [Cupriavidus sp. AcVe19-6a]|uniref:tyrosine-type recombinase/integrase n=1 Tax=Cupriavidus sp. AcVe19-6a TaxID=2821358 RepID=UPI001AE46705|nr:integrase family protein [Cupriavidus sp. AcVe19-6a]MBP0640178.1 tyrosine-type recombinase/integrase [Cupriavidus sp. AcVe19-6a]